ncbi:MAG: glycosyltransferase family 1 protein [Actinomycetota bacterium]|nr:glycosyltransferase family 1 protein [Actinomycetota bacterium]MDA2972111.1 glycosyltransferase family 1 protein [Actinomycetota bacterium]MDA3001824.1 glycosyltransferase family 1 protein [Actinomycetota bacterium]
MLTIAVDTGPLHGPATGIARATSGLVDELSKRDVRIVPYVLSLRARLAADTRRIPLPAALALRTWAATSRPRLEHLWRDVDVVHGTNYVVPPTKKPRLVSVYDCWALDHPQYVHADVRLSMNALRRSVDDGAVIHASSHATARRLTDHFPDARVEVIHLGPTDPRPAPTAIPTQLPSVLVDEPFIACIGTIERRKNVPVLIESFTRLADQHSDVRLVIAGSMGDDAPLVEAALSAAPPGTRSRIHVLGRVDDDGAAWILRHATVLAYPSLDEGFGFPLLEAMSCDVPIVASDAGSIPEIAGDAALFVRPSDVDGLARRLADALTDETLRRRLIEAGRSRRAEFSWATSVDRFIDLYGRMTG